MKIASIAEIKKELNFLEEKELIHLISELSKFSIDNKRFLFFLLYGRENPRLFQEMVQEELLDEFQKARTTNYHFAKKSAQSIRRKLNKFLKYSKDKSAQVELIIFFCKQLKDYGYLQYRHPVIENLYRLQIGKIEKLVEKLHEDLQYDYEEKVESLKAGI